MRGSCSAVAGGATSIRARYEPVSRVCWSVVVTAKPAGQSGAAGELVSGTRVDGFRAAAESGLLPDAWITSLAECLGRRHARPNFGEWPHPCRGRDRRL